MLPYELIKDKDGLWYINDDRLLVHSPLMIDKRDINENRYYQNGFYRILSTNDYIIKYSYTVFTRREREAIKNMLINLTEKQNKVFSVDFPIGYFKCGSKLSGLIIRYYQDGVSFDNILNDCDIELLGKYYSHDEDNIHNLFMLFNDVLNSVYEMFENGIYYMDIHPGNIVLTNNSAKLIDFDTHYIKFDEKDKRLQSIMGAYLLLLKESLSTYCLENNINENLINFEEAKKYTKKLENIVRRG